MNGAVSHELRNPLSSLLSGIDLMNSYVANLNYLVQCLNQADEEIMRLSKTKIGKVLTNLEINSNKMKSSSKLIDYFVHDMLDFTVLSNDKKNFIKKNQEFPLYDSINEVIQIMEDKIKMKNIQLSTDIQLINVNSDHKRIQQVFLNIFSNAIKFSDRLGTIHVKAKLEN